MVGDHQEHDMHLVNSETIHKLIIQFLLPDSSTSELG